MKLLLIALLMTAALVNLAAADDRVVATASFLQDRDFANLGTYQAPNPNAGVEAFGRNGEPTTEPSTRTASCIEGAFSGSTIRLDIVHAPSSGSFTIPIYRIDNPSLKQSTYAITGQASYDNLDKSAYLELWSEFPEGQHYAVRGDADSGPRMKMEGSSATRDFRLSYSAKPGITPKRLILNLIVPGTGTITLSDVAVVEDAGPATTQTLDEQESRRSESALQFGGTIAATQPTTTSSITNPTTQPAGLSRWWTGPGKPPVTSSLYVPTAEELDAEFAKESPEKLQDLVNGRDQFAVMLSGLKQQVGADHPMYQRTAAIVAAMDRRVIALGGPALTGSLAPQPVSHLANDSAAKPSEVALADLPPAVAVAVRKSMQDQLVKLLMTHDELLLAVDNFQATNGPNARVTMQAKEKLAACNSRIKALQAGLAEPLPAPVAAAQVNSITSLPYIGPAVNWFDRHFGPVFLALVGSCLTGTLLLRQLARNGRGRGFVLGFFGLMIAVGAAELFAAGVAMGLGRPASAWATLLGCAAIAIVIPAAILPQIRRQYADLELRKIRALDVA